MFKYIYKKMFSDWTEILKKMTKDCDSVLDLACGYNSPIQFTNIKYKVGVESFPDYLKQSIDKNIHNEYIEADILKIDFEQKKYDLVFCSEVIEHLEKDDGLKLLERLEKWSKKKIIITTPNGFLKQDEYDNNPLQIHKSGWTVKDFKERGYSVYGIGGLKYIRKEHGIFKYRPYFIWRFISDISQKIVFYFPQSAFQIFAIKNIKNDE